MLLLLVLLLLLLVVVVGLPGRLRLFRLAFLVIMVVVTAARGIVLRVVLLLRWLLTQKGLVPVLVLGWFCTQRVLDRFFGHDLFLFLFFFLAGGCLFSVDVN